MADGFPWTEFMAMDLKLSRLLNVSAFAQANLGPQRLKCYRHCLNIYKRKPTSTRQENAIAVRNLTDDYGLVENCSVGSAHLVSIK